MRALYSGLKYNFYNSKKGGSFEYETFYSYFKRYFGSDITYLPFEDILSLGKQKYNKIVLETIQKEKPDIFFSFMFTDELDFKTLDEIKKYTTSIAWFADDHWRFHNYSKYYAPYFSRVVTTYSKAVEWYKKAGIENIIHSQWAVDTDLYKPTKWTGEDKPPEVSFVGSWSRPRAKIIETLKKAGIPVSVYGKGWDGGHVSQEKMIEIFSHSKINLALNPAPDFLNTNSLGRLFFKRSLNKIVPDFHIIRNIEAFAHRGISQIKARHFEIPACGGFLMTSHADDLENYYKPEEIVLYENIDDFVRKIKFYLSHDKQRENIAHAGYERTIRDHTYKQRFEEIFKKIKNTA